MLKLVKNIVGNKCNEVALGTDTAWYISQGFTEQDVEQAYDGSWYLQGYAPVKPPLTDEDKKALRNKAYKNGVTIDGITITATDETWIMFASGANATPFSKYADDKATIQLYYQYSNEVGMTKQDYKDKITAEYNASKTKPAEE